MTVSNSKRPPESPSRSPCVVPEAALRWLILHDTTSNVALARLSNVNRSWREVVTTVTLEQATNQTIGSSGSLLLLPSMASQLIRKTRNAAAVDDPNNNNNGRAEQPGRPNETFCAAWFAPEGIQFLDLDAEQQQSGDEEEDDDDDDSSEEGHSNRPMFQQGTGMHRHCRQPFSANSNPHNKKKKSSQHNPSRSKSPMMHFQNRAPRLEQIPQRQVWVRGGTHAKPSFEDQGILVSHEWRGYRHAMEVLFPFGYAELFVQHVLQLAQDPDPTTRRESNGKLPDASDSAEAKQEKVPFADVTQTTIAVRGATIARPEGYCLCWERPNKSAMLPPIEWTRNKASTANDKKQHKGKNNDEMVRSIKWQERQRKLKQWKEWRRQLQLTVLPQVLIREAPHSRPVIQFLNSNEKHAVRFLTPKFQCGPIGEPITIFVVGIATEDGCFCSGLHHRFELGHLYPNTPLAELAEMSPICMATDAWDCDPLAKTSSAGPRRTPLDEHLDSDDSEHSDDDVYTNDDSSSELAGGGSSHGEPPHKKRGWLNNCACTFHDNSNPCGFGISDSNSAPGEKEDKSGINVSTRLTERQDSQTIRDDDDEDEDDDDTGDDQAGDAERILRGSRIPGIWHCYTAVFDGKHSLLRVDGVPEVLTSSKNTGKKNSTAKDASPASKKSEQSPRSRQRGPRPMLDGLTIGSDHCFDMTLCFGEGSGGEGEGAIAEIAVFGGCLATTDLETMERQLMIKHGIPTPELTREGLVQEDEWTRKAHALYCQTPPEAAAYLRNSDGTLMSFDKHSIPLRVMANHRSVAWHQVNAVTGEELRIKRIGSRSAGSSSDW